MKLPSRNQWRHFFNVLSRKERISFMVFLCLFIASAAYLSFNSYYRHTRLAAAPGGEYVEGIVGYPRFLNPIYSPSSEVDEIITSLIFSGLMKYDNDGKIQPGLAKECTALDEGKVYECQLKENLKWQDNHILTADDVIFTVETIQNAEVDSPLRSGWLGVEVERSGENGIRFTLRNESAVFWDKLTLKIIPKHIWEKLPANSFALSPLNQNPIGSGPYKLKNAIKDRDEKITSLELERSAAFYGEKPYVSKIFLRFFDNEKQVIEASKWGEIKGFSLISSQEPPDSFVSYRMVMPRYFALFFNVKDSKLLSIKEIRQALNYGADRQEILEKALSNQGETVQSPLLPSLFGLDDPSQSYDFNIDKAKEILDNAGFPEGENGLRQKVVKKTPAFQFKKNLAIGSQGTDVEELQKCLAKDAEIYPGGEISGYYGQKTKEAVIRFQEKYSQDVLAPAGLKKGTGDVKEMTRTKLNQVCFDGTDEIIPLKFTITTVDQDFLKETAQILKSQWEKIGAQVEISVLDMNTLERDVIRKRNFDALLFGEALGLTPDPFAFWHSSQKGELGLNLSNYENKDADKLLEEARKSLDPEFRKEKFEAFQNVIIADAPAVFLFNPYYLYFVSPEIKGIGASLIADPADRMENIQNWYIRTKRTWN